MLLATAELHRQCAVYTDESFAPHVLKASGWSASQGLRGNRLLEPSVGEGVLLATALRQVCIAAKRAKVQIADLRDIFLGFEIDADACASARARLLDVLVAHGVGRADAKRLTSGWIRHDDFLTQNPAPTFQYCVANPPYVRFRAVPELLRERYAELGFDGADLSIAFMARSIEWLIDGGQAAFLCNDRWPYAVHGASVRDRMLERSRLVAHIPIQSNDGVYSRRVGAYAALSVLRKNSPQTIVGPKRSRSWPISAKLNAREQFAVLEREFLSFEDAGCAVRVGPAFGHSAFKLPLSGPPVPRKYLVPLVTGGDIGTNGLAQASAYALFAVDREERVVNPSTDAALYKHLSHHRAELKERACVKRADRAWFEPIDRLRRCDVSDEKLLVAGIARTARIAHDPGGLLPSNGVYMIRSRVWPYRALMRVLASGLLDLVCDVFAPRLGGGSRRYQASVIRLTPLPDWNGIPAKIRETLDASAPRPNALREALRETLGIADQWYRGAAAEVPS